MAPDEFQQAWQAQSMQTRITIDRELLLNEVRRSQHEFQDTISVRDRGEVHESLLLIPVWLVIGYAFSLPWAWYLVVPALLWVAGFILVDRERHKQEPSEPDDSLLATANKSLLQVEHQIWLLQNVAWWYLLPLTLASLAFFLQLAWNSTSSWWVRGLGFTLPTIVVLGVYAFIYWLNQFAVRTNLQPRRQELLSLIAGLGDDSPGK